MTHWKNLSILPFIYLTGIRKKLYITLWVSLRLLQNRNKEVRCGKPGVVHWDVNLRRDESFSLRSQSAQVSYKWWFLQHHLMLWASVHISSSWTFFIYILHYEAKDLQWTVDTQFTSPNLPFNSVFISNLMRKSLHSSIEIYLAKINSHISVTLYIVSYESLVQMEADVFLAKIQLICLSTDKDYIETDYLKFRIVKHLPWRSSQTMGNCELQTIVFQMKFKLSPTYLTLLHHCKGFYK